MVEGTLRGPTLNEEAIFLNAYVSSHSDIILTLVA